MSFRVGLVQSQDLQNARVRVIFPDRNQLLSWWLPILVAKSQNDKSYYVPDIGEQVVCFMDEHDEDGAVLGSIYSQADTTPVQSADKWHISMKDGAIFEYDRAAHVLAVSLPNGATMTVTANNATVQIDSSGDINLTTQNSRTNINLQAAGNITLVTGTYDDSVNNMIATFNEHTHGGVQAGSSNTAKPNQQMP
jgi:phage baseplate assembly protein V